MLEQKDLDMIRQVVREEVDERANKTEDFLLEEIGNTQTNILRNRLRK